MATSHLRLNVYPWTKTLVFATSFSLLFLGAGDLDAASHKAKAVKKNPKPSIVRIETKTKISSKQVAKKEKKQPSIGRAVQRGKIQVASVKAGKSKGRKKIVEYIRRAVVPQQEIANTQDILSTMSRRGNKGGVEQERLAQTIKDRLGVEVLVQDDPKHSGGLFIAPPSNDQGEVSVAKALDLLANLPLGRPVQSPITSLYGGRIDPINRRHAFHEGIDFEGKVGQPIQATGKGVVTSSCYSPDYGEHVIVSHENGYETVFAHLSKRLVQPGCAIKPGETIGLLGRSGRSTGPHLHYEIRFQGAPINPVEYIKLTQKVLPRKSKRR